MGEVTQLIERAREGDRAAFDRIFELLYPELRQIARRRLSRNARDGLIVIRPSERSASQIVPMPPRPISEISR